MKKNILILALLLSGIVSNQISAKAYEIETNEELVYPEEAIDLKADKSELSNIIDKKIDFIKWKKKSKDDWFNFKKKYKTKIVDLMKKHHDECFDLIISEMKEVKSKGFSPELIRSHLLKALDLDAKQYKECEKLHMEKSKEAMKIKDRHNEEREQFKATV